MNNNNNNKRLFQTKLQELVGKTELSISQSKKVIAEKLKSLHLEEAILLSSSTEKKDKFV